MQQQPKSNISDQVIYTSEDLSNKTLTLKTVCFIKCRHILSYLQIQVGWSNLPFDAGMVEARESLFQAVQ